MTPERLQQMIAEGETPDVEFKGEAARPLSDADLVEAAVCLANRSGTEPGWLLIGGTARGIDTIFFEQLRNGRPAPSYARSTEASVVLAIPGGEANLEFARIALEESQAGRPLSLDDLLLLNELWLERRLTTAEAARLIQKPEADARTRLARLVEIGLVEPRGEGQGRAYHLSAAVYRRLGDKAGYVRQRGFEPLQHEQMVLQFARSHSRITRAEVAQLCRLTSGQAKALLKRLVNKGLLVMTGTRRGAYYEPKTLP